MKKLICIVALAMWSPFAHADGSAGNQFYQMLFGTPDQQNQSIQNEGDHDVGSENCDGYGGVIGAINSFFCHMEKDMGITGPGSATKIYGTMEVHAEINIASTTISGVTYNDLGEVWICNTTTSDCSQTANYQQAYYIAFSYDPISGINKGYAVTQPGIFNGQSGTAMAITYDIGTANATKTVTVESVFINGSDTYKMWASGQKTSTSLKLDMASYDTTNGGVRFAVSTTPDIGDTKYFNMYFEGSGGTSSNGYYLTDAAGISSAPATSNGLCLSADDAGSSITDNIVASSNCNALSFLPFSDYALTGSGSPNVQSLSASTVLNGWNGMPANPSSL